MSFLGTLSSIGNILENSSRASEEILRKIETPTGIIGDRRESLSLSEVLNKLGASKASSVLSYGNIGNLVSSASSIDTNKSVYSPNKDYIPCYVINILNGRQIVFDCEPEEISDNVNANFDAQEIRGRSSPYQGYNTSGPREISFSVTLHDDLCKLGLLNTVNLLKALCYPDYYSGYLKAPKCRVRVGDMISCYAICTGVDVNWQKPYRNNIYTTADISLTFSEVVDVPFSYSEIESGGGFI